MFYVFDCTKTVGIAMRVPFGCLALIAATVLSKVTGRFHDFAEVREFEQWTK